MPENRKTIRYAVVVLAVAVSLMLNFWFRFQPERVAGWKNLTIQVTHSDASVNTFTIGTAAEFLGDALLAEELIQGEEGQFGMYVRTVDGETAEEARQQYWVYTKKGEQVNYGVDMCPITDGEQYEFILKTFS